MRKNRLIALIGTLTMAAAGLAAVSAGVSSKKADSVSAYGDWSGSNYVLAGTMNSWSSAYSGNAYAFTYDKWVSDGDGGHGYNQFILDNCVFEKDAQWKLVRSADGTWLGSNMVNFDNLSDKFTKDPGEGNITVSSTFKAKVYLKCYRQNDYEGDSWPRAMYFEEIKPTVSASVNSSTMGTASVDVSSVSYKGSATFTAVAKSGYEFVNWTNSGSEVSTDATYTLSNITSDTTLTANFKVSAIPQYHVSYNPGTGSGTATTFDYNVGSSTSVKNYYDSDVSFTAPSKKKFSHWLGSDGNQYNAGTSIGSSFIKDSTFTLTAVWKDYDISDGYYIEFSSSRSPVREKLTWNGSEGTSSNHNIEGLHLDAGDSFKVVKYEDEQIKNYFGTDKADNKDGAAIKEGQLYANGDQDYVVRVEGDYDIYFNDQYDWEASNLVWVPANTYTVTYKANEDGSGDDQTQTAYYYYNDGGTGTSFAKNVFASTTFAAKDSKSKTFVGWCTSADGQGTILVPGDMQATSDKVPNPASGETSVTLYAIWRDKVPADGYYVKIFTDGHQANIPMALKDGSTTEYVVNVDLAKNDEFKVVYYQDEVINESTGYHGYTELKSGDGSAKDSNELTGTDNIVASKAGNYEIYYETGSVNPGIWAPNLIDVTFNANGHGTAPQGVTIRNGNAISDPGDLSEDDWTFTGWFEDQACQNEWDFTTNLAFDSNHNANYTVDSANNTCTKTLYAGWEEEITDPTVTVEVNDDNYGSVVDYDGNPVSSFTVPTGSQIEIDDESIIIGDDVYLEAVPADNGTETSYKFVDWTISPSCETVDGDITITANFEEYPTEYKVTLSYNSEYGSVAKTGSGDLDKVPYGTVISVDTENSNVLHVGNNITLTATPEDEVDEYKYSFTGWTFTSPLSGAQTITANFARANKYALLYDLGGGEAIGDYDDDGYYVEGTTITLPTDVEKEGYEFKGFYDNEDFEGTPYEGSFVINEDTYLYAKLTKETYSVSYNKGQYGDGEIASQTKTYGESLTLSSSVFTRTGYTQVGWATSDGGEKAYDLGGTYSANAGVTLYPVWELNTYTVSYDKGSYGQGEIASQTKSYGINLALRDSVFTRTGYTQVGWATSDGGSKVYDLGGTYSENAGVTLYPVWELNTYTVSYDKGSYGQGEIASQTKSYGINLALRDSVFTRTGYTQVGWATSDGGEKAYDLGGIYSDNAGVTLYPVWKANTYVVNYAPGTDATGSIDSQEKVHDVALTLSSSTFTKEGYEQIGWAISDGGEKVYDLGGSYTANEGVTLYPVWRETALHKAQVYANNFKDKVGGLCEDTENILDENRAAQLAALATEWANQAEAFAALDQDVKDILMSKDITPNPEGTDIEKFISLYDYTMGRYPQGDGAEVTLSNFLSRTQSSAARKVISISDVSTSTWIIAAVAIVGIAAAGVFFIYRKRKEI